MGNQKNTLAAKKWLHLDYSSWYDIMIHNYPRTFRSHRPSRSLTVQADLNLCLSASLFIGIGFINSFKRRYTILVLILTLKLIWGRRIGSIFNLRNERSSKKNTFSLPFARWQRCHELPMPTM